MATSKKTSFMGNGNLWGRFITYLLEPRKKNKLVEKKIKVSRYGGGTSQGEREKNRRRAQIARGMHRPVK